MLRDVSKISVGYNNAKCWIVKISMLNSMGSPMYEGISASKTGASKTDEIMIRPDQKIVGVKFRINKNQNPKWSPIQGISFILASKGAQMNEHGMPGQQ